MNIWTTKNGIEMGMIKMVKLLGRGFEFIKNKKNLWEYINTLDHINNGNGTIKEYYPNGNIIYERRYSYGRKMGRGKEYHFLNGKLKFECQYQNGKNGKVKFMIYKIILYMN